MDSISDELSKSIRKAASSTSFDIFLSHSHLDKELIVGAVGFLESFGYSVYLDSKLDPAPYEEGVTREAAAKVRKRMEQSKCLFFATTEGASESKWMPWELGFMDGKKGRCAILPISTSSVSGENYLGREYLGVYPYVTSAKSKSGTEKLWVNSQSGGYVALDSWLDGDEPYHHD